MLATTRADVNGLVRRRLDARKASFAPMDDAVALTGMEYGGITPLGLPDGLAGAGRRRGGRGAGRGHRQRLRRSKLALPGALLAAPPGRRGRSSPDLARSEPELRGSRLVRSLTADLLERWNKFNGVSVGLVMTETLKLPVLPLADSVVLPGMVVPVRLDEPEIQAAVDAASVTRRRPQGPRRSPPRRQYAAVGTIAVLEQVGRLPSGEKAAVVRGEGRARIGSGVTGPGAALWVEATAGRRRPRRPAGRTELAKEYKALVVGHPAAARAPGR